MPLRAIQNSYQKFLAVFSQCRNANTAQSMAKYLVQSCNIGFILQNLHVGRFLISSGLARKQRERFPGLILKIVIYTAMHQYRNAKEKGK